MTATAFDTLKFARRLKDSGVSDNQAEALPTKDDIQEIVLAINKIEVATQSSINELKTTLEAKITLIQWMLGIVIAAQVLPLLRSEALPFEPLVPNAETIEAMKEARRGNLPAFEAVDDLMADLNADD